MNKFINMMIFSCSLVLAMSGIANAAHKHAKSKIYHLHFPTKTLKSNNGSDYINVSGAIDNLSPYSNISLDSYTMNGLPRHVYANSIRTYKISIPTDRDHWIGSADYVAHDGYRGCHFRIEAYFDDVGTNLDIQATPLDDYTDCYMNGMTMFVDTSDY